MMKKLVIILLVLLAIVPFAMAEDVDITVYKTNGSDDIMLSYQDKQVTYDMLFDNFVNTTFTITVPDKVCSNASYDQLLTYLNTNFTTSITEHMSQLNSDEQTWFSNTFTAVRGELDNCTTQRDNLNLTVNSCNLNLDYCYKEQNLTETAMQYCEDDRKESETTNIILYVVFAFSIILNILLGMAIKGKLGDIVKKFREKKAR